MGLDMQIIERAIKHIGSNKTKIAEKIGMTREGFTRSIVTNKLQADKLELLSVVLKMPYSELFGGLTNEQKKYDNLGRCIMCELKDELLELKTKEITALQKIIHHLEIQVTTRIDQ